MADVKSRKKLLKLGQELVQSKRERLEGADAVTQRKAVGTQQRQCWSNFKMMLCLHTQATFQIKSSGRKRWYVQSSRGTVAESR